MIPLRDVIPSRTRPFVTVSLMVLSAAVFVLGWLWPGIDESLRQVEPVAAGTFPWMTILVAMFLHGGWPHLAGNLLVIWILGGSVEDRMGHGRYLGFYLLTGAAATAAQHWTAPLPVTPLAGASGPIAGVIGAYLVLFPQSRVLVLVPVWKAIEIIEVPAILVIGLWFLLQLVGGFGAGVEAGRLAHWVQASGLAAGLALVWVFRRRERETVEWWSTDK